MADTTTGLLKYVTGAVGVTVTAVVHGGNCIGNKIVGGDFADAESTHWLLDKNVQYTAGFMDELQESVVSDSERIGCGVRGTVKVVACVGGSVHAIFDDEQWQHVESLWEEAKGDLDYSKPVVKFLASLAGAYLLMGHGWVGSAGVASTIMTFDGLPPLREANYGNETTTLLHATSLLAWFPTTEDLAKVHPNESPKQIGDRLLKNRGIWRSWKEPNDQDKGLCPLRPSKSGEVGPGLYLCSTPGMCEKKAVGGNEVFIECAVKLGRTALITHQAFTAFVSAGLLKVDTIQQLGDMMHLNFKTQGFDSVILFASCVTTSGAHNAAEFCVINPTPQNVTIIVSETRCNQTLNHTVHGWFLEQS